MLEKYLFQSGVNFPFRQARHVCLRDLHCGLQFSTVLL
jgi:hypothetical protein